MTILFNADQNTLARDLCSTVGTCLLLIDQREMTDPREMTGWKADEQ